MNRRELFTGKNKSSAKLGTDDVIHSVVADSPSHRILRDPYVDGTIVGANYVVALNDSEGNANGWEVVSNSENMQDLNLDVSAGLIYSPEPIPLNLAETEHSLEYRARNEPYDTPAGIQGNLQEEFDRYAAKFTINYMINGNPESLEFFAPNSVTKKILGWSPEEPIPFWDLYSLSAISNPNELESAFTNLNDILNNPDNYVMRTRLRNRNTPSPCPDPNPWEAEELLLSGLSIDPLQQDDLYPTQIAVEMTDFGGDKSNGGADYSVLNNSLKKNKHLEEFIKQYLGFKK